MTDQDIFDNWIKTHPVRVYVPKFGVYDPIAASQFVGAYSADRQLMDAWSVVPDGEWKYQKAKDLTKAGAVYDYAKYTNTSDTSPDFAKMANAKLLHDYWSNMEEMARYFLASDAVADTVIAAYNRGHKFGPLFTKAFADYGIPRGSFTRAKASSKYEQWKARHAPGFIEKFLNVVVPVFLVVVAAVAVAGIATTGAAASAGSAGATATTTGTAAATTTAGTTAATVTPGVTVLGVNTGVSLGSAAINSLASTVATGAATGAVQSVASGGSAGTGAQAGAQSAATGAVVEGAQNMQVNLPQIDLGNSIQLDNPFAGYGGVTNPFANIGAVSIGNVQLPGQGASLTVPTPPASAGQGAESVKSVDWEKIAKVALPAISILLLLTGR